MILAGFGVVDDTMTMGDFVLVNAYLLQMFMPRPSWGRLSRDQTLPDGYGDHVSDFSRKYRDQERPNANELKVDAGHITFDGVTFDYDPRRPVLKGKFSSPVGETVAIVGASGSGKSTISRLLFRFTTSPAARSPLMARISETLPKKASGALSEWFPWTPSCSTTQFTIISRMEGPRLLLPRLKCGEPCTYPRLYHGLTRRLPINCWRTGT